METLPSFLLVVSTNIFLANFLFTISRALADPCAPEHGVLEGIGGVVEVGGFVAVVDFLEDDAALGMVGEFGTADVADIVLGLLEGLGSGDVLLVELKEFFHEQDGGLDGDIPEADDQGAGTNNREGAFKSKDAFALTDGAAAATTSDQDGELVAPEVEF